MTACDVMSPLATQYGVGGVQAGQRAVTASEAAKARSPRQSDANRNQTKVSEQSPSVCALVHLSKRGESGYAGSPVRSRARKKRWK